MPGKEPFLNIVCLDVPYPANYGGAMEEFYKLKALHEAGVKIVLHCFTYGDRSPREELKSFCEKIFYYPRKRNVLEIFSAIPFIVKSRMNKMLLANLLSNDYPILFDATHSTGFLNHPALANRKKIVRLHNIEWIYYHTLFRSSYSLKELLFYYSEYKKLRVYDNSLRHADLLICLSQSDYDYYAEKFSAEKTRLVYVFHENNVIKSKPGKGTYLLYHGNLSILDNYLAAMELLGNALANCAYPIKIAGKDPDSSLAAFVRKKENVELIANPSQKALEALVTDAHICLAVARNPSGIKLKLINSMYRGRFVFSNESAFEGSGLESCVVNIDEMENVNDLIEHYMHAEFTQQEIERRAHILQGKYDNAANGKAIARMIFSLPDSATL
jgi:glycosyltransferase involved in cell wall biosynthesis